MKLSRKCHYALAVILDLSNHTGGRRIHIREMAERRSIPQKFLEQILLELKQGGFVRSKKGPNGGYRLSRPPQHIMVGEIINLIDKLFVSPTPDANGAVPNGFTEDDFYGVLQEVDAAVGHVVNHINFAEIRQREIKRLADANPGDYYCI